MTSITSEHKDLATKWMYEVVIDSKIRSEIFLHSVTIFDYFLELCLDVEIQQVQLCASACLRLASKVRNDELEEDKIIDYTDNSITKSELKVRIIELLLLDIGIYFFRQVTTFIKVCMAFVFGLQSL